MGNAREQALRQHAGKRRNIHLHEVGQFGVEDLTQGRVDLRIVAADSKNAPTAEKVEIFGPLPVPQILPLAAHETNIVADRPQNADHLLIHIRRVKGVPLGFVLGEKRPNVNAHAQDSRPLTTEPTTRCMLLRWC